MQSKFLDPTIEEDFKQQAVQLKAVLETYEISIKHTQALEMLSRVIGFKNYKDRCLYMKSYFPSKNIIKVEIDKLEEKKILNNIYREVKADIIFILNNYERDDFLDAVGCNISELTEEKAFYHICLYIEKYKQSILQKGISSFAEGGVFDVLKSNLSSHVQCRNINLNPIARISFDDIIIAEINENLGFDIEYKKSKNILSERLIEYGRVPMDYTWGYKNGSSTFNTAMVILDECLLDYDLNKKEYKKMTRDFADKFLIYYNQEEEANISERTVIKWVKSYKQT